MWTFTLNKTFLLLALLFFVSEFFLLTKTRTWTLISLRRAPPTSKVTVKTLIPFFDSITKGSIREGAHYPTVPFLPPTVEGLQQGWVGCKWISTGVGNGLTGEKALSTRLLPFYGLRGRMRGGGRTRSGKVLSTYSEKKVSLSVL